MNLEIKIGKEKFKNPIWTASGTFGYGEEFQDFFNIKEVGAIVAKTITLKEKIGNKPPRVVETAAGLLNSIGLENKGVKNFIEEAMPFLKKTGTKFIVSIAGENEKEFTKIIEEFFGQNEPHGFEINLSCPNVQHKAAKHKLMAQDAETVNRIIRTVRKKTKKVIIAKLTPNVTNIADIAQAAEDGGADAVSVVNTYFGMAVDAYSRKPLLGNVFGGLSGPAIKPLALKAVYDVYKKVSIPIIGVGGIINGIDVAEFILSGATAVQVGTANLVNPRAAKETLEEFKTYLRKEKIKDVKDLIGKIKE